jgi:hypothetical protein
VELVLLIAHQSPIPSQGEALTALRHCRFDATVVLVSLGMISASTGNGVVKQLRILRVFRIIRVFGRIGQLREIVNAISSAIIPAAQALVLRDSDRPCCPC